LGEESTVAEAASRLEDLPAPDPVREAHGASVLFVDGPETTCDQFLAALATGPENAPRALARLLEDPRVRPAILQAIRTQPLATLSNCAQAAAVVGGDDVAQALWDRFQHAGPDSQVNRPETSFDSRAGALSEIAASLLRLGHSPQAAARKLIDLTKHACLANRQLAARLAVESVALDLPPDVLRDLLAGLASLLDGEMTVASAVAPALLTTHRDSVLMWSKKGIREADWHVRSVAIRTLSTIGGSEANAVLSEALAVEASGRLALRIVKALAGNLPPGVAADVVERALRDESPTVRLQATYALTDLGPDDARHLAMGALSDEPDPTVRRRIETLLSGSGTPEQGV